MSVRIKLSEKLIKNVISRSPNGFLPVNRGRLQWKAPELHLVAFLFRGRKRIKNKSNFVIKSLQNAIAFAGITRRSKAEKKNSQKKLCFFFLYFAVQCHLLFCLRKNSLLFPNPQSIAKPLPTVRPKLNKSVVWKRKLLGWRRAQHRAERPHSSQLKPVCSFPA